MAKVIKVAGKIVYKAIKIIYLVLFQSGASKVDVAQYEWSPVYQVYVKKQTTD